MKARRPKLKLSAVDASAHRREQVRRDQSMRAEKAQVTLASIEFGGGEMPQERKADVLGVLAELEHELDLAIRQGAIDPKTGIDWKAAFNPPGGADPWIALLTVKPVPPQALEKAA